MSYTILVENLKNGKSVQFRPQGNSMSGKIESGQLVTLTPFKESVNVGDVVLAKVKGKIYLHLISAIKLNNKCEHVYQISNNKNYVNGWTKTIYGIVSKVE